MRSVKNRENLLGYKQRLKHHPFGASWGSSQRLGYPFSLIFGRGFSKKTKKRALVIFEANRISFSQIYPFIYYRRQFEDIHDVEFRFIERQKFEKTRSHHFNDATHVFFQHWLTDDVQNLIYLQNLIGERLPHAVKVYLDSFANCDLRFGRLLNEIDFYGKKSLFADKTRHLEKTIGHTNLSQFYGNLYGIKQEFCDWNVPASILPKTFLSPNFLTDYSLIKWLEQGPFDLDSSKREIDLHARLGGTQGEGWYAEMRRDAHNRVSTLSWASVLIGEGVSQEQYRHEMQRSKMCFSPFGYGEICWRDIEAIAAGALLLKPDMSHLATEPNLYRDGETYVAIKWDFSDLHQKIKEFLFNDERRISIAKEAWRTAKNYIDNHGPVRAYSRVFER